MSIRSDHGDKFQNLEFENFCKENGIGHTFSALQTSQQNGVVGRKSRPLEELTRMILNETNLPNYFWGDVVSIIFYLMNHALIGPILKLTPYEL